MSTQFTTRLEPPGPSVLTHPLNPSTPPSPSIPPEFTDALTVRVAVFVDEQECDPSKEIDDADPRSWHWIVYSSINAVKPAPAASSSSSSSPSVGAEPRRVSESGKKPIGTVRLQPPPHPAHPEPGCHYAGDAVGGPTVAQDRATRMHDGREPYVKLGRLATLKEYRGLGLGRLLVNVALDWAVQNKEAVQRSVAPGSSAVEREREMDGGRREEWRGLVLIHAQKRLEGWYGGLGFVADEGLGTWWEEGIEHVGMWRRLEV